MTSRDDLAATVERVRDLCALPDPDAPAAMQPYAVGLDDGVHLAALDGPGEEDG